MMIVLHVLFVAIMVSCGVVFAMEDSKSEFGSAEKEKFGFIILGMPDRALAAIKGCAINNEKLTRVLGNKKGTEQLLDFVGERCSDFWRENAGIGCRDRQGFHKELAAAVLGTPGAIVFGREYVQDNDEAKERLQMFLSNIVVFGREDDGVYINGFIFPNEGLDIIKAGLDILGDPQNDLLIDAAQRNKIKTMKLLLDRGVDKEFKREFTEEYIDTSSGLETISTYTQRYTALYMAVRSNKQDAVDLLIQRGAHVNTTDAHGRTPLIMAAMRGHVEIVKKLFAAGAITWLIDAFDKGALDYAQEKLAKQKLDENKEKYEKIIQLLQDVDAKK
jgi:hypothetical protein